MTVKKVLIFAGLIIVIVLWESLNDVFLSYPITNFPPENGTVLAWGDSLTYGVGASDAAHGYIQILSKRLSATIENESVIGETSKDTLLHAERDIASTSASTVMIFIGGNDMLQGTPPAETVANVRKLIALAQAHKMVVYLIGFQKHSGDAYATGFEQLAKETGSLYVPDVLGNIIGDRMLMSDEVHPNDKGYLKMADKIAPTLEGIVLSAKNLQTPNNQ